MFFFVLIIIAKGLETSSSESGSRIEKEKNEKEKEERSKRKSAKKFLSLKVGSLKQNEEKNSPPVPARILLEADEGLYCLFVHERVWDPKSLCFFF